MLTESAALIRSVSKHYDSDVILYVGPIERPFDDVFIERFKRFQSHPNVLLLLSTQGGDANAAYRLARALQDSYDTVSSGPVGALKENRGIFRLFVYARCKSAGTVVALGANTLLFSEYGEIGPIDVQLGDQIGDRSSGLTQQSALESLQILMSSHFEDCFQCLRTSEHLTFSTMMASDVAAKMTTGLYGRIYSQVDPMRIGDYDRAMKIAEEYGARLGKSNLKEHTLKKLLHGYPSHEFVIDRKEAVELFKTVEEPIPDLIALGEAARSRWQETYLAGASPLIMCLTGEELVRSEEIRASAPSPKTTPEPPVVINGKPSLDPSPSISRNIPA